MSYRDQILRYKHDVSGQSRAPAGVPGGRGGKWVKGGANPSKTKTAAKKSPVKKLPKAPPKAAVAKKKSETIQRPRPALMGGGKAVDKIFANMDKPAAPKAVAAPKPVAAPMPKPKKAAVAVEKPAKPGSKPIGEYAAKVAKLRQWREPSKKKGGATLGKGSKPIGDAVTHDAARELLVQQKNSFAHLGKKLGIGAGKLAMGVVKLAARLGVGTVKGLWEGIKDAFGFSEASHVFVAPTTKPLDPNRDKRLYQRDPLISDFLDAVNDKPRRYAREMGLMIRFGVCDVNGNRILQRA